jgi:phage protein D
MTCNHQKGLANSLLEAMVEVQAGHRHCQRPADAELEVRLEQRPVEMAQVEETDCKVHLAAEVGVVLPIRQKRILVEEAGQGLTVSRWRLIWGDLRNQDR